MASSIRWGLLSTARINRALIPPITSLPRHSLRAVASRDAATAKAYAAEWDIPVCVRQLRSTPRRSGDRCDLQPAAERLARGMDHSRGTGRQARVVREAAGALGCRSRSDRGCGVCKRRRRDRSVHVSPSSTDDAAEGTARQRNDRRRARDSRRIHVHAHAPRRRPSRRRHGRRQPLGRRMLSREHGALPDRTRTVARGRLAASRRRRASTTCSSACWISTVPSRSSTADSRHPSGPNSRLSERLERSRCRCPSSPARTSSSSSRAAASGRSCPLKGKPCTQARSRTWRMRSCTVRRLASASRTRGATPPRSSRCTNQRVRGNR